MLQEIFKFSTENFRGLKNKARKKNRSLFRTPFISRFLFQTPFFQGLKIFSRKFENFLHHRIRHLEQNVFVFSPNAEKKPILLSTFPLI